jgi:hypothetical protein
MAHTWHIGPLPSTQQDSFQTFPLRELLAPA